MSKATIEHDEGAAAAGDHGAHPTEAFYIRIAIILAVVTGVEVWLSYAGLTDSLTTTGLVLLAGVKFVMVAAYFMHLKFDTRIVRRLFAGGFILAVFCYVAYLLTLGVGI